MRKSSRKCKARVFLNPNEKTNVEKIYTKKRSIGAMIQHTRKSQIEKYNELKKEELNLKSDRLDLLTMVAKNRNVTLISESSSCEKNIFPRKLNTTLELSSPNISPATYPKHNYSFISKYSHQQLLEKSKVKDAIDHALTRKQFSGSTLSRRLLATGLAHCPKLSSYSEESFIPCIIASFLESIDVVVDPSTLVGGCSPCANTLQSIINEASIDVIMSIRNEIFKDKCILYLACDKGNKKGLDHFVKIISWWSKKNNQVEVFTLDIDAANSDTKSASDAIYFALKKIDNDKKTIISGVVTDGGGGGTVTAGLGDFLVLEGRLQSVEALTATCTIHGFQLGLSNPCKTFFGDGGIEERNIMQLLFNAYNLQTCSGTMELREFANLPLCLNYLL